MKCVATLLFTIVICLTALWTLPVRANSLADPGKSGSWYDPAHDGEGFVLQVLEDDRAD